MNNSRVGASVLTLLFLISCSNYVNRHLPTYLLPAIQQDLSLSDTQAGLFIGLVFSLTYGAMAIPVAWLADHWSRARVIALSAAIWSAAAASCGLAGSYATLVLARMGVGVGQAGVMPAMSALIADQFPLHRRGRAGRVITVAMPLSGLLAGVGAGVLFAAFGWRNTFIIVGAPGLILSALALRMLRDAPREQAHHSVAVNPLRAIGRILSVTPLTIGVAAATMGAGVLLGTSAWNPIFYLRVHGLPLTTVAPALGLIFGVGGMLGMLVGSAVIDRLGRRDLRWYLWLPALGLCLTTPALVLQYLAPSAWLSLAAAFPSAVFGLLFVPSFMALMPELVESRLRATASAIFLLAVHGIGAGIGPMAIGVLSQHLDLTGDGERLRYAIIAILPLNLAAIGFFLFGATKLSRN